MLIGNDISASFHCNETNIRQKFPTISEKSTIKRKEKKRKEKNPKKEAQRIAAKKERK